MPRWRLTRTEPWVRPVRAAISSPDIPSTSRSISVSRYASGRARMAASAPAASAAAALILGGIARDARDPAGEGGRIAQRGQLGPGCDEDVLHDVVGIGCRKTAEK